MGNDRRLGFPEAALGSDLGYTESQATPQEEVSYGDETEPSGLL